MKKTNQLHFLITDTEADLLHAAALTTPTTFSQWGRDILLKAAWQIFEGELPPMAKMKIRRKFTKDKIQQMAQHTGQKGILQIWEDA